MIMLTYGLRRGEALGLKWLLRLERRPRSLVKYGVKRVQDTQCRPGRRNSLVFGELKT